MNDVTKVSKGARVAVVDDQISIGNELVSVLQGMGYTNVKFFSSPKTAWETFRLEAQYGDPYELIFLDINMPGMTGTDLLKQLRATDTYKKTPIFMVTTESEKDTVILCIVLGATDYIVKPYTAQTVKEKLEAKLK